MIGRCHVCKIHDVAAMDSDKCLRVKPTGHLAQGNVNQVSLSFHMHCRAAARFLLLAATKDVVWPSAAMTSDIEASLRAAHKESLVKAVIFPEASHYICGTGSEPRRINPVHKPESDDPPSCLKAD